MKLVSLIFILLVSIQTYAASVTYMCTTDNNELKV